MALTVPTVQEISDNIISSLEASLNQTIPSTPKSFLRILARVFAAVYIILYKYGSFQFKQIFVATATDQETDINGEIVQPLSAWGNLVGVTPRTPAVQAELDIELTVIDQTGTLPAGTTLLGQTNGVTYATTTVVDLTLGPSLNVVVKAVADQSNGNGAGEIGNLDAGAVLTFVTPDVRVANSAVVNFIDVQGADEETEAAYRQRIVQRFQQLPQGGAYTDYRAWATEVSNIINAYVYANESQPGQVDVYCEADNQPDGIPTPAQLSDVANSIGQADRRPVSSTSNVVGITRKAFDVTVDSLSVADIAAVEQQIEDALEQFFLDREPFIAGLSVLPRKDKITQPTVSAVVEDIVSAAGGTFIDVEVEEQGGPVVVDYTLANGEKAKLGVVNFI